MNRERALSPKLLVKITPLPIMALDQLQFPRAAPFLDALFAEDRIGHRPPPVHARGRPLGPRFRGDDENLSSLPSEDTEAR